MKSRPWLVKNTVTIVMCQIRRKRGIYYLLLDSRIWCIDPGKFCKTNFLPDGASNRINKEGSFRDQWLQSLNKRHTKTEIKMDSNKMANIILGRDAFINEYCKKKGWKKEELDFDQILEIRKQEGWKNPKEVALQA